MKVLHVTLSDSSGGAARAALRIVQAPRAVGLSPRLWVSHATSGDPAVEFPYSGLARLYARARPHLSELYRKRRGLEADAPISLGGIPTDLASKINRSDADVVNLHWINGNFMSIRDVGRIQKPCVWTLHDMWPFSGILHCRFEGDTATLPKYVLHCETKAIRKKQRLWKRPITLVTPGEWMLAQAQASQIMSGWPAQIIPVPLDTEKWVPIEKAAARQILGIGADERVMLFGAFNGEQSRLKGFDLLKDALSSPRLDQRGLTLLMFGGATGTADTVAGIPARNLGRLSDDITLRVAYSAADVFVTPSRIEAFGQTASEAHACGTPVVCFGNSGLRDVVEHEKTGYVARAFLIEDLVAGINWILSNPERGKILSQAARQRAETRWNSLIVGRQYTELYEKVLVATDRR